MPMVQLGPETDSSVITGKGSTCDDDAVRILNFLDRYNHQAGVYAGGLMDIQLPNHDVRFVTGKATGLTTQASNLFENSCFLGGTLTTSPACANQALT